MRSNHQGSKDSGSSRSAGPQERLASHSFNDIAPWTRTDAFLKYPLALVPLPSLYQPSNSIFVNSSGIVRGDSKSTTSESACSLVRLRPQVVEDVLQRWKKRLKSGGDLNFSVIASINGFYRVVGSTSPPEDASRQNSTKVGEGIKGFFGERRVVGYGLGSDWVKSKEGKRQVFDRHGQVLAEIPLGRGIGILGRTAETKWHYYKPVFEKSAANPWSTRVVGLFAVFASADDADSLFKSAKFQRVVDSVATEVSPYLDAIQVLTGEEKL